MKYNILKIMVLFFFFVNIANANGFYKQKNKIDSYMFLKFQNLVSKKNTNFSKEDVKSNFIFGLKGMSNIIGNNINSFAQIELSLPANKTEINKDINPSIRLGFIGLQLNKNNFIDYGRNYGILYDSTSYIDKDPFLDNSNVMFNHNDLFMFGRANNILTYRNKNFFDLIPGLNIAIQYQRANNNSTNILEKNNAGLGASIEYSIKDTGVSIIGAYFKSSRMKDDELLNNISINKHINNNDNDNSKLKDVNGYAFGAKYSKNNLYLATVFSGSYNGLIYIDQNSKFNMLFGENIKNLEIIGQYKFNKNFKTTVSYIQSQGYNIPSGKNYIGGIVDLSKYFTISTTYMVNKNLSASLGYKINLLNNNNEYIKNNRIFNGNVLGFGLVYHFKL
ncbi:hypothetical protein GJT88_01495 [Enterobacteriaceae endosymbiont of Donacia tomentosa]|uniref:porin n=1 Tax=Enterobacteriaceae endosymbiont of Donacia tomentosa TaxID=2675787 RepID=UPI001448B6E1|nr:porin [Enterobacteriaceae endosymbiont of Donacia tomentosa]QJC31722.1 hypothetical protein GJT88_01495 [Enterobacteriaceae endosymbiont of Donacia tomentosa]